MKENRESFWRRHQEGDKEGPSYLPYQGLIYFYQTNSHNTHLKLTRLVPAIKSSYQTHSHSIHFKMTGFRRFLKTLKKEKHVLKQDTLLYWLKTKQYKKKVCPFLFLEILRPLSPPQGTQTSYQPTKELALFHTHTHTHTHTVRPLYAQVVHPWIQSTEDQKHLKKVEFQSFKKQNLNLSHTNCLHRIYIRYYK